MIQIEDDKKGLATHFLNLNLFNNHLIVIRPFLGLNVPCTFLTFFFFYIYGILTNHVNFVYR